MCPIESEVYGHTKAHEENADLSIHAWSRILGVSEQVVLNAARRAEIDIVEQRNADGGVARRSFPVSEFPNLIKGFQETPGNGNAEHYHPWSLGVNTDGSAFVVQVDPNTKIAYTPPVNSEQ